MCYSTIMTAQELPYTAPVWLRSQNNLAGQLTLSKTILTFTPQDKQTKIEIPLTDIQSVNLLNVLSRSRFSVHTKTAEYIFALYAPSSLSNLALRLLRPFSGLWNAGQLTQQSTHSFEWKQAFIAALPEERLQQQAEIRPWRVLIGGILFAIFALAVVFLMAILINSSR